MAEILTVSVELMRADGVAGLSLSEVARRMGVRPPSLYAYFPSKLALYDALFRQSAERARDAFRSATAGQPAGWDALCDGVEALLRLAIEHPVHAQLAFWRPVPGFEPSPDAFAPSQEFVQDVAVQLEAAVQRNELAPDAATPSGNALLSVLVSGLATQHMANQPDAAWADSAFLSLTPRVLTMFKAAFPA